MMARSKTRQWQDELMDLAADVDWMTSDLFQNHQNKERYIKTISGEMRRLALEVKEYVAGKVSG